MESYRNVNNEKKLMNQSILESIERYKDFKKDDELTKKAVERYLTSKHGHIKDLEELFMNLLTGLNRESINYDLAEQEFKRIRNIN